MLKNKELVYFLQEVKIKSIYFLSFILKDNVSKRGKAGCLDKLGVSDMAQEKDGEDLILGTDLAERELGNGQDKSREPSLVNEKC